MMDRYGDLTFITDLRQLWSSGWLDHANGCENAESMATTSSDLGFFALTAPVGRGGRNHPPDVALVQFLLCRSTLLDLGRQGGPSGRVNDAMFEAIMRLQFQFGLRLDSLVVPGGRTHYALLARTRIRPTAPEENPSRH